jgi:hypothetical protein
VFNQQSQASVDNTYTLYAADPIVGGTKADLPYLKQVAGSYSNAYATQSLVIKNLNYGNTTSRFSPLSGRFGVTLSF